METKPHYLIKGREEGGDPQVVQERVGGDTFNCCVLLMAKTISMKARRWPGAGWATAPGPRNERPPIFDSFGGTGRVLDIVVEYLLFPHQTLPLVIHRSNNRNKGINVKNRTEHK